MKNNSKVNFVKTTVIGGVVFLVPLVFLIFIISQAMEFMMLIAEPLADWIPIESIGDVALANLLAIVALSQCHLLPVWLPEPRLPVGLLRPSNQKSW